MKSFKEYNSVTEKVVFPNGTEYYEKAAEFFLKKMGVNPKDVKVAIQYKKGMGGDDGFTSPSQKIKNGFVVYVKEGHPSADMLRVIAHEMVHVKQMVDGELKMDFENSKLFWKGEEIDLDNTPYRRRPFEVEAFKLEKKYIQDYIKAYGNNI